MGRKKGYRKYGVNQKMISLRLPENILEIMDMIISNSKEKNRGEFLTLLIINEYEKRLKFAKNHVKN